MEHFGIIFGTFFEHLRSMIFDDSFTLLTVLLGSEGPKNRRKNITYFRTYFFSQKSQKYVKKGSQKVSKRVRGFRGWRPWGRLGRHNLIFDVKDGPKVLQRCPKVLQKCCQSASRDRKLLKKMIPKVKNVSKRAPQKGQHSVLFFEHFW